MFNRMYVAKNPYQNTEERVLVICSAGLLRSPTVAAVMWNMGYNTRAAGIDTGHALIPVDEVLVHWADSFVVMEDNMATILTKQYPYHIEGKPIYNYMIMDNYERNDPELVAMAKQRTEERDNYVLLQEESPTQTEEG